MAEYEFKAKRWKFENSSEDEEEEMFFPTIYEQPALSGVQRETGRIKDSGGNFLTSALQTLSFPICRSTFPQLLVHTLKKCNLAIAAAVPPKFHLCMQFIAITVQ